MTTEIEIERRNPFIRIFLFVADRFRPPLGWLVWGIGLLIALLPALAIREADWIDLGRVRVNLEWVSLFSLWSGWWLVGRLRGWSARTSSSRGGQGAEESRPSPSSGRRRIHRAATIVVYGISFLLWMLLGILIVSQVLVHWIPGPIDLWRAARAGDLLVLAEGVEIELNSLLQRYSDWARGVQAGGAYQDDFVFLTLLVSSSGCLVGLQHCSHLPRATVSSLVHRHFGYWRRFYSTAGRGDF